MMRKSQWFMVAVGVVLLGACNGVDHPGAPAEEPSASKEEGGDPLTAPVAVVKAFFKAMQMDDRKTMARLMTPKRSRRMEKQGTWDAWLAVWKRFAVGADGEGSRREPAGASEGPGGVSGRGSDDEGQRDRVADRRSLVLGRELRPHHPLQSERHPDRETGPTIGN